MSESSSAARSTASASEPSSINKAIVTVLADVRILMGVGSILAPHPSASLFGLPLPPASRAMGQFFGVRELVLGGLLYTTYTGYSKAFFGDATPLKSSADSINATKVERKESLKNILWACLLIDSIDLACIAFNALRGEIGMRAICVSGGAGVLGVLFAGSALRTL